MHIIPTTLSFLSFSKGFVVLAASFVDVAVVDKSLCDDVDDAFDVAVVVFGFAVVVVFFVVVGGGSVVTKIISNPS